VGAGSVVTKSVEAGTVVAGVPAQRLLQSVSQPITK
jgi:acetyltransferase-like isoleucine patch superfamily enzyme